MVLSTFALLVRPLAHSASVADGAKDRLAIVLVGGRVSAALILLRASGVCWVSGGFSSRLFERLTQLSDCGGLLIVREEKPEQVGLQDRRGSGQVGRRLLKGVDGIVEGVRKIRQILHGGMFACKEKDLISCREGSMHGGERTL